MDNHLIRRLVTWTTIDGSIDGAVTASFLFQTKIVFAEDEVNFVAFEITTKIVRPCHFYLHEIVVRIREPSRLHLQHS